MIVQTVDGDHEATVRRTHDGEHGGTRITDLELPLRPGAGDLLLVEDTIDTGHSSASSQGGTALVVASKDDAGW